MNWPLVKRSRLDAETARARDLAIRVIASQDEVRYWRERAETAEAAAKAASADSLKAREMVADWLAQRSFGVGIFAAPQLPETAPDATLLDAYNTRQGLTRARDVVKAHTRAAYEAEAKFLADMAAKTE